MASVTFKPQLIPFSSLSEQQLRQTLRRPAAEHPQQLSEKVGNILQRVATEGDEALREFTRLFDQVDVPHTRVVLPSREEACEILGGEFLEAFWQAHGAISAFHKLQKRQDVELTYGDEIWCQRRVQALETVGFYVPGGAAPLFSSAMMMAIPAQIAGCSYRVLCTPPQQDTGQIPRIIAAVASLLEIDEVHALGGAQAIAAMGFGTQHIRAVDKVFGPGNVWVNEAKLQIAQRGAAAIDLPAGPSEVMVVADESAQSAYIAADLLAQAEHGEDSHVICVLLEEDLFPSIIHHTHQQLMLLPRRDVIEKALRSSVFIAASSLQEALTTVNTYAPEHLILHLRDAETFAEDIKHAGSVFLGSHTPETLGDYASGTNHVLPTAGYARYYGGLTVESFEKTMTLQRRAHKGPHNALARAAITLARAEGLSAHAGAMQLRLDDWQQERGR